MQDQERPKPQNDDKPENGPGMTNGVPDDAERGEATALPHSDREKTETAGKGDA